jgi:hypothetical protein
MSRNPADQVSGRESTHCATEAKRVGPPHGGLWVACKSVDKPISIDFPLDTLTRGIESIYVNNINLDAPWKRAIMGFDGNFGNLGRNPFDAAADSRLK